MANQQRLKERVCLAIEAVAEKFAKLNASSFVGHRFQFTQSVYGPELCNDFADETFHLCTRGYGPFVANVIKRSNQPFVFLDIGANAGIFTLVAASHPLCQKAYAFEPVPATFFKLCVNVKRSGARNVETHRTAISGKSAAFVKMEYNPQHSGMARIVSSADSALRVRTIDAPALSKIVRAPQCAILVKIDVEGAEREVFHELSKTGFFEQVERIVVEVSRRNSSHSNIEKLYQMLTANGFAEGSRAGEPDHYDALFERHVIGR